MDTPDRREESLPSWPSNPSPALPIRPAWDEPAEVVGGGARSISVGLIFRAFRRHWWQILALWFVASGGLAYLAYVKIKPTYDSTAWLKVEPSNHAMFGPSTTSDFNQQLDTAVQLITSPDVLNAAAQDEKVAALPRIRGSLDPEAELRKEIRAAVAPRTHLILVTMTSEAPEEPARIVNTVVKEYLRAAATWTDNETKLLIDQLKGMKKKFATDQEKQRETLKTLVKKAGDLQLNQKDRNLITLDQYKQYKEQISNLEVAELRAVSRVGISEEMARLRVRGGRGPVGPSQVGPDEAQVLAEFQADPAVRQVMNDYQDAAKRYDSVADKARKSNEYAKTQLRGKKEKALAEYNRLKKERLPRVRARLTRVVEQEKESAPEVDDLQKAKLELEMIKTEKAALERRLEQLEVDTKNEGAEALEIGFARTDLEQTQQMLATVNKSLDQLDYEARGGAKVSIIAEAKPSPKPTTNRRVLIVAATPVVVFVALLGLFILLEVRAGRVANPDDLPARVRLGVIGVVPPLPGLRPARTTRALRDERRRVEEFVQSLDHLRITLGAGGPGARRCVLITSAIGGEGKTTLAAQLAGRCANAGLLTLLIDADLRRPSLGELLEVPEGPGLADVLLGEADPEAAMVVIGSAGGFHLLPAGAVGHDPARLLQGERLGQLLAQFRATFDVVIVDAPPVLAVPDALILGRWTDGAVLAVRHDTSRFPLVERANRRLAAVGVPVLGAVVNGCRTPESGYGAYHYASTSSRETAAE
jgi:succinoglycan biosynthesis transport protein ExoP